MSHSHPAGLLAAYNSLTDKHLAGYFNNTRIRRHLLRSGLITRSGRILSEKEYKLNIMKRDHQKYIRECLAQAVFHKVLDMERNHQLEVKKKLETLARKERIQRLKGEYTRRSIENNMPILSPHPPVGPKSTRGHSVLVDEGHSSPLTLTAPRPYTAPGNMQPPIRLQPLPSNPVVGRVPKITSGSRSKTSLLENEAPFPIGGKKAMMKFRNSMNNSQRMNPYQLPNINSYMMPIPPLPPPPDGKITRENRSETWRRRRFRPITAPNGLEPLFTRDSGRIYKTSLHSNAAITMVYLGKNVHLAYDDTDFRDEIKVYQQHCGGENLCVYKGKLLEKETFQFISKRHHGFPFSLTFFLNGIQVNRLSSCCEYKHRKSSRLGGKRGYFGFVCVERASPCYKCIIAMGLDKKPRKDKSTEKRELRKDEGKLKKDRENVIRRRNESEENKPPVSASFSAEEIEMGIREVRTAMEEINSKGEPGQDVWEDNQENTFKDEYEEDFEVDEEKQDEKVNEEGQAADQMNGISKSPSEDEKDDSGPEKESEILSQKAPDADDNVKDEDDGCSETESEEDKQDIKTASSTSSRSHPYSSDSDDDSSDRDREAQAENSMGGSTRSGSLQELSENDEPEKSHLPIEESLEIEIEEQEITKADVETKPLPRQESHENVLEEEIEKGTQGVAENVSEKSRKHASKEEKEGDKSKRWEESSAEVKDKMAGLPGVEDGVGQIISEALALGCHRHYDTEPGAGSTDEGGKPTRKLESDTGGAPSRNSVVEERAALNPNKESKHAAQETHTMEKKEAVEEGEAPPQEDADLTEGKGDAVQSGKAGVNEVPLREGEPAAEQLTEESQVPGGAVSGPKAEAKGDIRPSIEKLNPTGMAAGGETGGLSEEEAPEEQALMQTMLETEATALGVEQSSEKAALKNNRALSTEHLQEVAVPREAVTLEKGAAEGGEAASEAGSQGPGVDESEQGAPTELEDVGQMQDAAPQRGHSPEEAMHGGEAPATGRKEVLEAEACRSSSMGDSEPATEGKNILEAEAPCSSWTSEAEPATERKDVLEAEARRSSSMGDSEPATERKDVLEAEARRSSSMGDSEPATERKDVLEAEAPCSSSRREAETMEELCEEGPTGEEIGTEAEINREENSKDTLTEEFCVAGEGREAERPETPLRETASEREEVTRANAQKDGYALGEEQRLSGEEEETVKEVRSEEQTRAPGNEEEPIAEDAQPTEATELTEDTELLEDSMETKAVTLLEATPGFGKSLGKGTVPRKEGGGERLREARDAEHRGRAELLGQEHVAPWEQAAGPRHDGESASGAPARGPTGQPQAPEGTCTATGEAEKPAAKDQDCLAAQERQREGGTLQGPGGAGAMIMTQEGVPQGDLRMVEKLNEEAVKEDPEEKDDKECALGTEVAEATNTEGAGALGGAAVVAEEDVHGGGGGSAETVPERREVLTDSKTAQGKTVSNKACSCSDVAGEEAWPKEDEVLGTTAAAERVLTEETALSREEVPPEEVAMALTAEAGAGALPEPSDVEGQAPGPGQDQEGGGEAEATQCAGSAGEEAGTEGSDDGQESGTTEEFQGGSSQGRESGLSRGSLEVVMATFPVRPDFSAAQEKQERLGQKDSGSADGPLNREKE